MVFQRPVMLRRSVLANLSHGLKCRGIKKAERIRTIEEILHHTGLMRLAKVPARLLSVGEQQRLAVSRAWALDPQVLFVDEPTAGLSKMLSEEVYDMLTVLTEKDNLTILLVDQEIGIKGDTLTEQLKMRE